MGAEEMQIVVFDTVDTLRSRSDEFALLIEEALGVKRPLEETLRQIGFTDGNSVIVAGMIGGELATMNAFMGQGFFHGDRRILAYQSGFSAARNKHRGKGLWPILMSASEGVLADLGGEWIFGFPNPVSHVPFTKKLHYRTINMYSRRIPALALSALPKILDDQSYAYPDLKQVISRKLAYDGSKYLSFQREGDEAVATIKRKFFLKMLDIGGWASKTVSSKQIFKNMCQENKANFIRIEVSETSQYFKFFNFKKISRPFIVKEIGSGKFPEKINIYGALSDTF